MFSMLTPFVLLETFSWKRFIQMKDYEMDITEWTNADSKSLTCATSNCKTEVERIAEC